MHPLVSIFYMEKLKSASRQNSNYILMVNPESKTLTDNSETKKSNKISVVLLTQNPLKPMFQHPHQVMSSIPRELSKEIIVVHYNSKKRTGYFDQALESTSVDSYHPDEKILHVKVEGEFASGVMRGIELSVGKYILVMDADLPYSRDIIPELVTALIENPNFIIVASRYVKDAHVRRIPFVQNTIGNVARGIARYGLKIKNIKDPTSACFAFTRDIVKDIKFEGKGKEALLEILVKINTNNNNNNNVAVKEIPIKQQDTVITRKLDRNRIVNYSKDVWELYRYGTKSNLKNQRAKPERNISKSITFLSKAGRFFTVGASGLVVNYAASFLISAIIPNIWYIHATLFGVILSITSNFILNKIWTFEDRNFSLRHFFKQYALFLALCTLGAVIQLSLVFVFVEYSHIEYALSLLLAVVIASLGNFLLNKKITFGEKIWE